MATPNGALSGNQENDYLGKGGAMAGGTQHATTFAGSRLETATAPGVSYFRNRTYDQTSGRWLQEDPIGIAGGLNLYQYNGNDPVTFTDPFGLCEQSERGNSTQSAVCSSDITGWSRERVLAESHKMAGRTMLVVGAVEGAAAAGSRYLFAGGSKTVSAIRGTAEGETFYHYSYSRHAGSLAGGLRAGSYTTTAGGMTGGAAKAGLSLPHAVAPDALYVVTPKPGTLIQVNGATRPAFGQPGGLPEIQFITGTGPGTVVGPVSIP